MRGREGPAGGARRALETIGWILVGGLFVLFNALLLTNHVRELLWLTLASLLPIWVLTAVGGSVELAALLAGRDSRKEGGDDGKTNAGPAARGADPAGDDAGAGRNERG